MEDKIYHVTAGISKSVAITHDEMWFSTDKIRSIEKFEKAVNKTGMLQSAYKVPLSAINEISYNESSQGAKIKYTNEKGKEKKLNIKFTETELSNQFGSYLGEKLGLSKTSVQEGQLKPLLLNSLFLLISIAGTVVIASIDDTAQITDSTRVKDQGMRMLLKLIVDTIGQTGVYIVGGLISLFLAYSLYKRFKNPSNEIMYSR